MGPVEAVVVFVISWWLFFLPVLSMGAHSQQDEGEVVPGSEPGAPTKVAFGPKIIIASSGAALTTAFVWAVLHFGLLNGLLS